MSTNPSAHLDGGEVARLVGDLCAALFADLDGIATEAEEQLAVASPRRSDLAIEARCHALLDRPGAQGGGGGRGDGTGRARRCALLAGVVDGQPGRGAAHAPASGRGDGPARRRVPRLHHPALVCRAAGHRGGPYHRAVRRLPVHRPADPDLHAAPVARGCLRRCGGLRPAGAHVRGADVRPAGAGGQGVRRHQQGRTGRHVVRPEVGDGRPHSRPAGGALVGGYPEEGEEQATEEAHGEWEFSPCPGLPLGVITALPPSRRGG